MQQCFITIEVHKSGDSIEEIFSLPILVAMRNAYYITSLPPNPKPMNCTGGISLRVWRVES
jgi:hypothetical protein